MEKVLLLTTSLYGYEEIIINCLKKKNYNVKIINYSDKKYVEKRKIKNPFLKIINNIFYRKIGKNLKDLQQAKAVNEDLIKENIKYDYIIKLGMLYLEESTLKLLKSQGKFLICHHWDKIIDEKYFLFERSFFDKVSSFSKEDSKKYNMSYLPNFYFKIIDEKNINIKNDIYTIMGDVTRKDFLEKLAVLLRKNGINYNFNLATDEKIKSNLINIGKGISLLEVLKNYEESKVILELVRERNKGTSTFRAIECLGLKKKLVTNNKEIVNEDYYNKNNILIINENNMNIPIEFINSCYQELPKEITEKYYIDNWISKLLKTK